MFLTSLKELLFSTLTLKMNRGASGVYDMGFVGQFDDRNPELNNSFFLFLGGSKFIHMFPFSHLSAGPITKGTFKETASREGFQIRVAAWDSVAVGSASIPDPPMVRVERCGVVTTPFINTVPSKPRDTPTGWALLLLPPLRAGELVADGQQTARWPLVQPVCVLVRSPWSQAPWPTLLPGAKVPRFTCWLGLSKEPKSGPGEGGRGGPRISEEVT